MICSFSVASFMRFFSQGWLYFKGCTFLIIWFLSYFDLWVHIYFISESDAFDINYLGSIRNIVQHGFFGMIEINIQFKILFIYKANQRNLLIFLLWLNLLFTESCNCVLVSTYVWQLLCRPHTSSNGSHQWRHKNRNRI